MRVLVACEFSGIVAKAFRERGHEAWSCDLFPTEADGFHIHGNVLDWLDRGNWDLMLAFPPCTHLACSGARYFAAKRADGRQQAAIDFFLLLAAANIPKIAIENPVGIMSTIYRKPDQILQPWQFGHGETKATCLWLKNLPLLKPTEIVGGGARQESIGCHRVPIELRIGREHIRESRKLSQSSGDRKWDTAETRRTCRIASVIFAKVLGGISGTGLSGSGSGVRFGLKLGSLCLGEVKNEHRRRLQITRSSSETRTTCENGRKVWSHQEFDERIPVGAFRRHEISKSMSSNLEV